MRPKYIIFDLKDDFNKELFLKRAKKDGFNLEEKSISPIEGLPEKSCIAFTKEDVYADGFIYGNDLYIKPKVNSDGQFWFHDLKRFAECFELE